MQNTLSQQAPEVVMTPLSPKESVRTYTFPGGEKVGLTNVVAFCERPSGNHRLKTEDGKLHIVPKGWLHIEIETKDWTC